MLAPDGIMMLRVPSSAVCVLLLAGGALAVPAAPQQVVRESAEAVLVEVPVRVVDRQGNPVRGLTAEDFELYDEGRRQTVVGFDAIDLAHKGREGPGEPGVGHPAARRRFLLLFDLSYSRPKEVLAARRAGMEFVLSGMGDQDLAAVATFSVELGVRLLLTFSADRAQLARAIDTLGTSDPQRLASDPLAMVYELIRLESGAGVPSAAGDTSEARAAGIVETLQTVASLTRARLDQYERSRVVRMTESLGDLATALDAVQGRKDVIYFSEGFETRLLVGARHTRLENEWIVGGDVWKVDSDKSYGNAHLQTQLNQMTELFRRTDCVIHAVDIGGLRGDAGSAPGGDPVVVENALFEMANETGGEVFRNDNNLSAQLDRLVARTSLVYVLAFRPQSTGEPDRYHELKVKVKGPGASVSARAGYYERKSFRALSPLEKSLSASDVIANEIPVEDIPVRVLASPLPSEGNRAKVAVLIEFPGDRFLEGQKSERATAELYAYANDAKNHLDDFFTQVVTVDLVRNRARLVNGGLRYAGELNLSPGVYRLRVLVRNAETGRMGLAVQSVSVPDFSGNGPYLAPPVFVESAPTGILVRGPARARGSNVAAADGLTIRSGDESLVPVVLPEVRPGSPVQVSVIAYHFADAGDTNELKIGAQVLAADGRPLGDGSITVIGRSLAEPSGRQTLLVAFTPQELAPGPYSLRVFLRNSVTGQAGHASSPFLIH